MDCVRRRGKVYCAVITVPVDLRLLLGRRQIWRSLKTRNYSTARAQGRKLLLAVEQIFIQIREGMDSKLINAMVAEYGLETLLEHDKARIGVKASDNAKLNSALSDLYKTVQTSDNKQYFASKTMTRIANEYQMSISRGKQAEVPLAEKLAKLYMARSVGNGLLDDNLDTESDDFKEVVAAFALAERLIHKTEAERLKGITADDSDFQYRLLERWKADLPVTKDAGIPMPDLFALYIANWAKERKQARATRKRTELKRLERSFTECFGKVPGVKEISDEMTREWRDYLQHEFYDSDLANKSVNNYVDTMAAVFNFGIKNKSAEINPFSSGLRLPLGVESENSRIFEVVELQKYINYLGEFHNPERPERIWIPLIMMYSGMRCNEIAQLFVDDIQEQDGIPYFRITNNLERNQQIKSETSKRNVPIHNKLIELGLLEYAGQMNRAGQEQLFPNCIYRPSVGLYYDSNLSTALNLPINLIDSDRKLRLYSLRANFRNNIEEKFVNRLIAVMDGGESSDLGGYSRYYDLALNDILGHAVKGSKGDTVYRKRRLHIMNAVLQQAEYLIDLTPLRII
jgi:integrase